MSLVKLREVPVTPAWPEARQYVVKSFPYYTASRPVFQSRTRFWEKDKTSVNVVIGEPALEHYWSVGDDVSTSRGLLVATAAGMTSVDASLAAFRKYYTGGSEDIEQAFVIDWARDPWAVACEPLNYTPGQLAQLLAEGDRAGRADPVRRGLRRQPELGHGGGDAVGQPRGQGHRSGVKTLAPE